MAIEIDPEEIFVPFELILPPDPIEHIGPRKSYTAAELETYEKLRTLIREFAEEYLQPPEIKIERVENEEDLEQGKLSFQVMIRRPSF